MVKYIIDSSALIEAKETYPPQNLKFFWEMLDKMNSNNELIIIDKVKDELSQGADNDYLKSTFLSGKLIFSTNNAELINDCLTKVSASLSASQTAGLPRWLKRADPFVVASALFLFCHTKLLSFPFL